jgi:molybdopterin converting factor subunit 1
LTNDTTIQVLYFAAAKRAAGVGEECIPLRSGMTAREVLAAAIESHPALEPLAGSMLIAVNEAWVPLDSVVKAGDVIALMPPVSGG